MHPDPLSPMRRLTDSRYVVAALLSVLEQIFVHNMKDGELFLHR